MFNLSYQEFLQIVKKYLVKGKKLVVPLYKEIVIDTETPVSLFLKLASKERFAYLLESAETSLQWGRYSFISFSPYFLFFSKGQKVVIKENGSVKNFFVSPFDKIKRLLKTFYLPEIQSLYNSLPRFFGGLVGYIGYENVHLIEPSVQKPQNDYFANVPDVYLMFNKIVLIIDHYLHRMKIVCLIIVEDSKDLLQQFNSAVEEVKKIEETIKTTISVSKDLLFVEDKIYNCIKEYDSNIQKQKFIQIVNKAKKYIFNGDVIQVVISRRLYKETAANPFDIYRALRMINPSPYMFYLKFDNLVLIGSSPEILVRKEANIVETRPIAGTRPRGITEEEDNEYEKELLSSEKENAEHIMLVDLARNDIGRIAKYSTVTLPQFKIIEKYSHVMHIVSSVKGVLKQGCDSIDVLISCFPAGTVSGAPKVRAMQIISELESETRGPYAGAVGYFSLTGNMDMAITIRTIIFKDNCVYIQTGAGIVADSNPLKEYYETINKAKALIFAVKTAETAV